jgi:catechol 2,3-dioxygenase-like lactoylglutathione lyase family enzyme
VIDHPAMPPDIVGFDHAGIVVPDLESAIDFYARAFGATVVGREADTDVDPDAIGLPGSTVRLRGALLRIGNTFLELHEFLTPTGRGNRRVSDTGIGHIAIAVSDIDAAHRRLQDEGMTFNTAPNTITEGFYAGRRWAYGQDPWGIVVELCQHPNREGHS